MRFGLLTIHVATNFGSALQAMAFLEYMKKICPEDKVELIDYRPGIIMDAYSTCITKNLGNIKQFIKYLLSYGERKQRNKVFSAFFSKYFSLSDSIYFSQSELEKDAYKWDAVLLGSDQIWNPEIVGEEKAFFLDFCREAFRASFSSSFGTTDIPKEYIKKLEKELKTFDMISVREPSAKDLLKGTGKRIEIVSDPVFLLKAEEWITIEKKPDNIPKEYIAFYTVQRNPLLESIVKKIADNYHLPIVDMGLRTRKSDYLGVHDACYGPEEFVYLIHHAKIVFTNSFHGTAFGTIFRKKCISMLHRERGTRIKELAELSGRTAYIVPEEIQMEDLYTLLSKDLTNDYSELNKRIRQSKDFLIEVVRKVHERCEDGK